MRKIFFFGLLGAGYVSSLFAVWDPAICFSNEELSVLEDVLYQDLKRNMCTYLHEESSHEKTSLLMDLIRMIQPELSVEIGVFLGSSILPILSVVKYLQNGTVAAVDAWSNAEAVKNLEYDDPQYSFWSQVCMETAYQTFVSKLKTLSLQNRCTIFRTTSETAAQFFETIDFIHFDGNDSEKGLLQDLRFYLPQVKSRGYILLSNYLTKTDGTVSENQWISELLDEYQRLSEIENGNVVLYRKP
jgi:hypothetical protein